MKNNVNVPAHQEMKDEAQFKGYSLEELKYQRAYYALRKEFAKEQILTTLAAMKPDRSESGGDSKFARRFGLLKTIGSKVFTNLNTLDYVMLGMSLFGTAKKAYSLFRKKK